MKAFSPDLEEDIKISRQRGRRKVFQARRKNKHGIEKWFPALAMH